MIEAMLEMFGKISPGHVFTILFAKIIFDFIKEILHKRNGESKMVTRDLSEIKETLQNMSTDITEIKTIVIMRENHD